MSTISKLPPRKGAHQKTQELADRVAELCEYGVPIDVVSSVLDISETNLNRFYRAELSEGQARGDAKLCQAAMAMALSGEYPQLTVFMCKSRLGWTDKPTERKPVPTKSDQPTGMIITESDLDSLGIKAVSDGN